MDNEFDNIEAHRRSLILELIRNNIFAAVMRHPNIRDIYSEFVFDEADVGVDLSQYTDRTLVISVAPAIDKKSFIPYILVKGMDVLSDEEVKNLARRKCKGLRLSPKMEAYERRFDIANEMGVRTLGGMTLEQFGESAKARRKPIVTYAEFSEPSANEGRTISFIQEPTSVTQLSHCLDLLKSVVSSREAEVIKF